MRIEKTDEYREWLDTLEDRTGRTRILVRVDRLIDGNPGQHRNLTAVEAAILLAKNFKE